MEQIREDGTVLVVDDVATNRTLLKAMLKPLGFNVAECKTGQECIDECARCLPALVLLDVMMPDMDGIETCRRLREEYSKDALPIIMVTTRAESSDLVEGLEAGANDYVTKPVDRLSLIARIESHLATSRYQREIHQQKLDLERALAVQNAMGDALPDAIAIQDRSGAVVYSNSSLVNACDGEKLLSIDEVFHSIYHGAMQSELQEACSAISEFPEMVFEQEYEISASKRLNIRLISRPFAPLSGQTQLRLWLWRDQTAVRELERKVNQRVKLEMVSVFASGVAHNFNNAFSGILGAAELLQRACTEKPREKKCLDMIIKAVKSGSALTRKMSVFVRKDLDVNPQERKCVGELVDAVLNTKRSTDADRIDFNVDLRDQHSCLNINDQNLSDIIDNLVTNSMEAIAERGKVSVHGNLERDRKNYRLIIEDDGSGIPAEMQPRLFEPFFSTRNMDALNNVSLSGRGLGLWNVYNLLMLSGGDIDIHSSLGAGTRVTISLPVL